MRPLSLLWSWQSPTPFLWVVCVLAWTLLFASYVGLIHPDLCRAPGGNGWQGGWQDIEAAFWLNRPAGIMLSWLLMLLAMMPLIVAESFTHIWCRSLTRRRIPAMLIFSLGYIAVWMMAGSLLFVIALGLIVFSREAWQAPVAGILIALVWQMSPAKQICLNRCHTRPSLSAFGWAVNWDCLKFGLAAGFWCVGTCWALMLLPMLMTDAHLFAMAAVTVLLLAERNQPGQLPRWRLPMSNAGSWYPLAQWRGLTN